MHTSPPWRVARAVDIKTLVTAVLCRTSIDTAQPGLAPGVDADHAVLHASAAARWAGATRVWQ